MFSYFASINNHEHPPFVFFVLFVVKILPVCSVVKSADEHRWTQMFSYFASINNIEFFVLFVFFVVKNLPVCSVVKSADERRCFHTLPP